MVWIRQMNGSTIFTAQGNHRVKIERG